MPYNILNLLKITILQNSSDLHLNVGYVPFLRIDGRLSAAGSKPISPDEMQDFAKNLMSEEQMKKFLAYKEIDFAYSYSDHEVSGRFRVNIFFSQRNIAIAMRLVPSKIPTFDELKFNTTVRSIPKLSQGFVLLVGPTGCGKSTTLASLINDINQNQAKHIITIEDPIEYVYPIAKSIIAQRELEVDTLSWDNALRSVLREDPNVVLIGELRDQDTMRAALSIAETGHLVFGTMHTNSAAETIERIIYTFEENEQPEVRSILANVTSAVISQRLVPVIGGGRHAAMEIMLNTPSIANMIREKKEYQIDNVIRTSFTLGMVTIEKSLVDMVRDGMITIETAQNLSTNPEEIIRLMKQI